MESLRNSLKHCWYKGEILFFFKRLSLNFVCNIRQSRKKINSYFPWNYQKTIDLLIISRRDRSYYFNQTSFILEPNSGDDPLALKISIYFNFYSKEIIFCKDSILQIWALGKMCKLDRQNFRFFSKSFLIVQNSFWKFMTSIPRREKLAILRLLFYISMESISGICVCLFFMHIVFLQRSSDYVSVLDWKRVKG